MNHTLWEVLNEQLEPSRFVADAAGVVVATWVHVLTVIADVGEDIRGVLIGVGALAARQVALIFVRWMHIKFLGKKPGKRSRRSRGIPEPMAVKPLEK